MTRFTDVPSVLLVNTDLAGEGKIEGYEDLLNPRLHGKIAMADPALSSSSYEQLINMLYAMGKGNPEDGWDYIRSLADNLDGNLLESSAAAFDYGQLAALCSGRQCPPSPAAGQWDTAAPGRWRKTGGSDC